MPHFSQREGRFFVSYVTGPSHVTLGLSFGGSTATPKPIRAPAIGECSHGMLDEEQILSAVNEGVAKATDDAGSPLYLSEIIYVENDSPNYDLFRYCAYLISRRLLNNEPFSTASSPECQRTRTRAGIAGTAISRVRASAPGRLGRVLGIACNPLIAAERLHELTGSWLYGNRIVF